MNYSNFTMEELQQLDDMEYLLPSYLLGVFRHKFNAVDADGSGSIDPAEVMKVFEELGERPDPQEVQDLISAVWQTEWSLARAAARPGRRHMFAQSPALTPLQDFDQNGEIEFEEFLHMKSMQMLAKPEKEDDVWQVFDLCDSELDGLICFEELKSILVDVLGEVIDDAEIASMISWADPHNLGGVTWENMLRIVTGNWEATAEMRGVEAAATVDWGDEEEEEEEGY